MATAKDDLSRLQTELPPESKLKDAALDFRRSVSDRIVSLTAIENEAKTFCDNDLILITQCLLPASVSFYVNRWVRGFEVLHPSFAISDFLRIHSVNRGNVDPNEPERLSSADNNGLPSSISPAHALPQVSDLSLSRLRDLSKCLNAQDYQGTAARRLKATVQEVFRVTRNRCLLTIQDQANLTYQEIRNFCEN